MNTMILGLNQLWSGFQVEQHTRRAVHWSCASDKLKEVFRNILKGDNQALNLLGCRAAFESLTKEVKLTYANHTESKLVSATSVVAEKVALPKKAHVILAMLDLLPEQVSKVYCQAEGLVSEKREDWEKARGIDIVTRMPRQEYVKILKRMFNLRMVEFKSQQDIVMTNGLQCVRKDEDKLRLIFDGRPVNCVLQDPPKVDLPGFHLLQGWCIAKEEVGWFGKIDLDNYYHRIGVPEWLKNFLGLPAISDEEVSWISEGREVRKNLGMVCTTLPMGLSHAVFIAQEIHVSVLRKIYPPLPLNRQVQGMDSTWVLVYIDDVLIGTKGEISSKAKQTVNNVIAQICEAYKEVGLEVNKDKLKWAENNMTGLGCEFKGKEGAIEPSSKRMKLLVEATRHMVSLEWINKKMLEVILGHWVWLILLRRPFFSLLFNVYRLLRVSEDNIMVRHWDSVKREFRLLIWLSGGLKMVWRREHSGWIIATDASHIGAGACETRLSKEAVNSLVWEDGGFRDLPGSDSQVDWTPIFQLKWGYLEHINVLEARAVVMCIQNVIQKKDRMKDRWIYAVDSMVVLGAIRKGRSSSYALNNQLRRILVLCLVAHAAVDVSWIPTDNNPADVLSRCFA